MLLYAIFYLAWFGLYVPALERLARWLRRRVKARIEQVSRLVLATVVVCPATASR